MSSTSEPVQHGIKKLLNQIPAAHALTGCNTVSYIYGIGKVTALEVLNIGMTLNSFGQHDADMDNAVYETTRCIAACYGTRTKGDIPYTLHNLGIEDGKHNKDKRQRVN